MSLESGLHRLKGLRKLKELNATQRGAGIGVQEVQWMIDRALAPVAVIGGLCTIPSMVCPKKKKKAALRREKVKL